MYYTVDNIEKHWQHNRATFESTYQDWIETFHKLVPLAGEVIQSLESRNSLAENCAHLLFSKAFNHTLAAYSLMRSGLLIDASLASRNALETFLMLELFSTDPTEQYFRDWANGKEFRPAWVRSQLGTCLSATVRDVIIEFDDDYYETVKLAYSFWSDITHANLKSAEYSLKSATPGNYSVPTAGSLDQQESFINCLFAVLGAGLLRCSLVDAAVFSTGLLQTLSDQFKDVQIRMKNAVTAHA
jgi:hypothetical protein